MNTTTNAKSVMLVGGPDTGKTHFLLSLVSAIDRGRGTLSWVQTPADIGYIEGNIASVLKGQWAAHTSRGSNDFFGQIRPKNDLHSPGSTIYVPDISGELWDEIIRTRELEPDWLQNFSQCTSALLFVRPFSTHFNAPLDWVTSAQFLSFVKQPDSNELPTQVALCELLNFLGLVLRPASPQHKPRIAVIISAWDRLNSADFPSPWKYLESQLPMFAGALRDCANLQVMPFGCSAIGGDLIEDPGFSTALKNSADGINGFVVFDKGHKSERVQDVTIPLSWGLGLWDVSA